MKKVGIMTIIGYLGYGNRLQNYATQEVIKYLGYDVQTIVYLRKIEANKQQINRILKRKVVNFINMTNEERKNAIRLKLFGKSYKKLENKLYEASKLFTQNNIVETNFSFSDDNIPKDLGKVFDFFVTGSDQVWNPEFAGTPAYFLTFAPSHKRIAYAASFGVKELPKEHIEAYKKYISDIPHLSVREQAGADIIKKLTGRDAIVLIDPTLMLSKERWLTISKPAFHKPSRRYLLTYFLGTISDETRKKINDVSLKMDLEVVQLASFKDKKRYVTDPAEFLDYVNSAEIVFTDSYHGTVFSIIFGRPFIVCDRIGRGLPMHSRIDTLLSKFKIESRRWQNIKDKTEDDILNIDVSHVPSILQVERKKALDFLKMSFLQAM